MNYKEGDKVMHDGIVGRIKEIREADGTKLLLLVSEEDQTLTCVVRSDKVTAIEFKNPAPVKAWRESV